jgi:hypothetical protein
VIRTLTGGHGARRRADLVRDVGEATVQRETAHGAWRSPWPGVLVPAERATEPLTVIAAALAFAGERAVVCGWTAAWLHGCRAVDPLPVHLAVPYGHWLRARPGLVARNGRGLDDDEVECFGLPVLKIERVVADLLCRDRPQDAFAVFDEALALAGAGEREALRARIAAAVEARPDPRGRRRAALLLPMATGLARSPAESRLQFRFADLGFPAPEINLPIADASGRVLFLLDLAWLEFRIAVEYDGYATHLGRELSDAERQRELERRGFIVIRATAADMRDITRLERELAEAFRRRGVPLRREVGLLQPRRHR